MTSVCTCLEWPPFMNDQQHDLVTMEGDLASIIALYYYRTIFKNESFSGNEVWIRIDNKKEKKKKKKST